MDNKILYRKCTQCQETKRFDRSDWLISGGAPAGKLCKKCVAARRRGAITAANQNDPHQPHTLSLPVIDMNVVPRAKLARIGFFLFDINKIADSGLDSLSANESKVWHALQSANYSEVCAKYIREILEE